MAGTATAPFLFAVASRLESPSSFPIVRCGMHGRGNIYLGASICDSTLTSPTMASLLWGKGGWGVPLVMGLVPSDLAKVRASFFFVAGPLGVGRDIFSYTHLR